MKNILYSLMMECKHLNQFNYFVSTDLFTIHLSTPSFMIDTFSGDSSHHVGNGYCFLVAILVFGVIDTMMIWCVKLNVESMCKCVVITN